MSSLKMSVKRVKRMAKIVYLYNVRPKEKKPKLI